MPFSCKIILARHQKIDGSRMVYLQAIIDRLRAVVPLDFYVKEELFDARRQCMKPGHPNAHDFDTEIISALARANTIASRFRMERRSLTPEAFRSEFNDSTAEMDFIKFFSTNLEIKKPTLAGNTHKAHTTVLNKLKEFKPKGIPFNHINIEMMQRFRNFLINKNNGNATIEKILKIVKQYLKEAAMKGITVNKLEMKIKTFKSNRNALTEQEVDRMNVYFESDTAPANHKKLLRYFLFSCYTGVRISDINILTWKSIQDDLLVYVPTKTKFKNELVKVPLLSVDKKYLPAYTEDANKIFDTFAEPVSNRLLKEIADKLGIRKRVTYHTSRHTFGSLMAEGGDVIALQRMMGHSDIKTTMGYVHTNVKQLVDAKTARFGKIIEEHLNH